MLRVLLILAVLLATIGCAGPLSGLTGATSDLRAFARADVQRGLEIATAANDAAGMACASAILKALPEATPERLAPAGVFSAFMTAREVRRQATSGIDEGVHNACAALVLDTQITLGKLGLMAVPGGGALGGLLRR